MTMESEGYIPEQPGMKPRRLRNPPFYIFWKGKRAYLVHKVKVLDLKNPNRQRPKKCYKCKGSANAMTPIVVDTVEVVREPVGGGERRVPHKISGWKCSCGTKYLPTKWTNRMIRSLGEIPKKDHAKRLPCSTLFRHCSQGVQEERHPDEKYFGPREFRHTRSLSGEKRKYYPRATLDLIQRAIDNEEISNGYHQVTAKDIESHAALFSITFEESRNIMFQEQLYALKREVARSQIRAERFDKTKKDTEWSFLPIMEEVDAKLKKMEMDGEMQHMPEVEAFKVKTFPSDVSPVREAMPNFEDEFEFDEEKEAEFDRTHPQVYNWLNPETFKIETGPAPMEGKHVQ